MSLHGPIKVQDKVIGYWQARRTVKLYESDKPVRYECKVQLDILKEVEFDVMHIPDRGAVALAALVLSTATDLL